MIAPSTGAARGRRLGGALRAGPRGDPRRRQLAGALVPIGGGPSLFRRPGRGCLRLGRRRQPVARLRAVLRRLDPRPRPSGRGPGGGRAAASSGTTFGAPTEGEVLLAEAICARVDGCEQVRLVSSGTEAAMSAVRVARGFTGRSRIVKFAGCYHGHSDGLLAAGGSGVATLGLPGLGRGAGRRGGRDGGGAVQPGPRARRHGGVRDRRSGGRQHGSGGAGRRDSSRGCGRPATRPVPCWCSTRSSPASGSGKGGASGWSGVRPDLWCFGKVIGGGLPVGAFGGRADVLSLLAPDGPVYQAGTLSGNPLATAAGLTVLDLLEPASYAALSARVARFGEALAGGADARHWTRRGRPMPRAVRSRPGCRWWDPSSASSSCRPGPGRSATTTGPRRRRPPASTRGCSVRCSPAAWPWPRDPTRWPFPRWPTERPSSTTPSRWPPRPSPRVP